MFHYSTSAAFRLPSRVVLCLIFVHLTASALHAKPARPVIFVHGFGSDASTWSDLRRSLVSAGWIFGGSPELNESSARVENVAAGDFYVMNFSDHDIPDFSSQSLHLVRRAYEVGLVVRAVLKANPSSTKAIIVGHSMGGVAARVYLQGRAALFPGSTLLPYNNDVASLITVGSPHLGAELAVVCQELGNLCLLAGIDPHSLSLEELRPDSQILLALSNLSANPLPRNVMYYSIVGTGRAVFGTNMDGDGIVTIKSQNLASLPGTADLDHSADHIWVLESPECNFRMPQSHTCETSDPGIQAEIIQKINSIGTPPTDPPAITTTPPTNITQESASLNLAVNPNGADTSVWFEWGTTSALGRETTPRRSVGAGTTTIPVSITLGGLTCNKTYYFRARAHNDVGAALPGETLPFTTSACEGGGGPQSGQLVGDPSFERGNNWWVANPDFYIDKRSRPRTGRYYAFLSTRAGDPGDNLEGGMLSQPFTIPANTEDAELRFWYSISTDETSSSSRDKLEVYLVRDRDRLRRLTTLSNRDKTGTTYKEKRLSVSSSFFGEEVQIFFRGTTNGSRPTVFRLDDVTLSVTTGALSGPPSVSTQSADQVTATSARLNMTVNPNGDETEVWFDFEVNDSTPNDETEHVEIGSGSGSRSISISVFGLECGTKYYFEANAENDHDAVHGTVRDFTTSACSGEGETGDPPRTNTDPARNITQISATLAAEVDPGGLSTEAWFEWGETRDLGTRTPRASAGRGSSPVEFTQTISGLACSKKYYFESHASNAEGEDDGSTLSFTTQSCSTSGSAPSVTTQDAGYTSADPAQAILNSVVNPNGSSTGAYFEWGTTTSYGQTTTKFGLGSGTGDVAFPFTIEGLACNTIYHFRAVATNDYGTRDGGDRQFTTASCSGNSPVVRVLTQGAPGQVGKDIWTTSYYSYAPVQGPPGGGLDDDRLRVGGWGDLYYSLLEFDLSGLPQHARSARIELFSRPQTTSTALYLDRITSFWDWRTQGTGRDRERLWWADRPDAVQWRPDALPAPTPGQWYSIDITDLYNAWQAGTYPNYGVQLRPVSNNNTWAEFYSANSADQTLRPKLVVEP